MIIFLLLLVFVQTYSSDITLTLSSGSTSKVIPVLQACSCQLAVFPVYGYAYNATVDILTDKGFQYLQIYIPLQNYCKNIPLNGSKRASVPIDHVRFQEK